MKHSFAIAIASALAVPTIAQNPGHQKTLGYPQLKTSECTNAGGCKSTTNNVVIDSNWMWTHKVISICTYFMPRWQNMCCKLCY